MPELPEVETCRAGIEPYILGKRFRRLLIREARLRWPIAPELSLLLPGLCVLAVKRRGKYILLETEAGHVLLHLGMSGNLRIATAGQQVRKHDHADFEFTDGTLLRFNDQRRFGSLLWTAEPPEEHALLRDLGPEPLSESFNAAYLHHLARRRAAAVKLLLMDSRAVVGVGNIYASEALFAAGVHPGRPARDLTLAEWESTAGCVKSILRQAIAQGGTTLRDFVNEQGKPGYFQQQLGVYGRAGEACRRCGALIEQVRLGQRSSFYCPVCQPVAA